MGLRQSALEFECNLCDNSRTTATHLTFESEEEGKGGWKFSRQGSVSPEKRGILPSCFLEAREDAKRDRERERREQREVIVSLKVGLNQKT